MNFQNNIEAFLRELDEGARRVCNETAEAIAVEAKALAPYGSGTLAASIYPVPEGEASGYGAAVGEARSKTPKVQLEPEIKLEKGAPGEHRAAIGVAVDYANIVHEGYGNRPGEPFLEDAVNRNKDGFEKRLDDMADKIRK